MIYPETHCDRCKHRIYDVPGQFCKAYPEGIPERFAINDQLHNKIEPGQKGEFVFTPED